MKSVVILITLASWSTAQIIYPDEFESMTATARPQKFQSDVLPFNNNFVSGRPDGYKGFNAPPAVFSQAFSPTSQNNDLIAKNVLKFALNIDEAVALARTQYVPGSRENVVFSPLSVIGALALVLLGSAGKTFEETSTLLGLNTGIDMSRNSETFHKKLGSMIASIIGSPGQQATETSFATGLFVRDGYPIRPQYKAASESIYESEVINLDFKNRGRDAQQRLNNWVSENTRGKISNILSEPPAPDTSVIIASALYFNGEWNQHFIDGQTKKKPFTVSPGETVNVDMMYNGGDFPFYDDKQLRAKIVGLPYKGHEITMYVVLPNEKGIDALRTFERSLNPDNLENMIRNMQNRTCILGLPRMKLSSTLSLKDSLQSLGLDSLFNPSTADLSVLSEGLPGGQTRPPTTGIKNPTIIFPRLPVNPQNYITYDDTVRGYHVEQWLNGFRLSRLRTRRSLDRKWLSSSEVSRDESHRHRRQNYQNEVEQSFGIDVLRNNGRLNNPGLFADDVLHRVEIDITEIGTEAAAATVVILAKDGNQKRLIADRPFLFFIRHETTGLILFWGSVNKPTPNYPSPSQ